MTHDVMREKAKECHCSAICMHTYIASGLAGGRAFDSGEGCGLAEAITNHKAVHDILYR